MRRVSGRWETIQAFSARSALPRGLRTPLRGFLRTETGSASVLLAATLIALVWANAAPSSYEDVWRTDLSIRLGTWELSQDLRDWVNGGLMTIFFFVIGLEARREFDMGELRERQRLALPLVAGVCGMLVPVAVYLGINAGHGTEEGWGTAMSTDTAFALGLLALVGSRLPRRLSTFLLTVAVVDDFLALVVIAVAYSGHVALAPLLAAAGFLVLALMVRATGTRRAAVFGILGLGAWVALHESGVEPVVVGLVMGLMTYAYPAARTDLERASDLFRSFREQPTPELERSARIGIASAISPNERMQRLFHPWSSYVIVPVFALANAGITISGDLLARAFTSPVTLGILLGYVLGKPLGVLGGSWLATRLGGKRTTPPVGWGAVAGGGTIAGIGFTVSLLIATLAFDGPVLEEAKVGVLTAVMCSFVATWAVTLAISRLPSGARERALYGRAQEIIDLADPVDPDRDHLRGPADAPVTLVEYGDFECPYCGKAEPVVRRVLAEFGDDVTYVWRHLPLPDVHPNALLAAEAGEAAAEQGAFWEMHARLLAHQEELRPPDLVRHAEELGLDTDRFHRYLRAHSGAARVAEDQESADLSGISGTPSFFINGRRHHGPYDIDSLTDAVRAARARALATS